jgi:hypothetical protein
MVAEQNPASTVLGVDGIHPCSGDVVAVQPPHVRVQFLCPQVDDILSMFGQFGNIVRLVPSRATYMFLEYEHDGCAFEACRRLNGAC